MIIKMLEKLTYLRQISNDISGHDNRVWHQGPLLEIWLDYQRSNSLNLSWN